MDPYRIEKPLYNLLLGAIAPILLFLAGWWIALPFLKDNRVAFFACAGLLTGLGLSVRYLSLSMEKVYTFSWWQLTAIYGFYSVCLLGFFMGVPVFNLALGLPAGFYAAMRQARANTGTSYISRTAALTALFMTATCAVSAAIALHDPYTIGNIRGMFRIDFPITQGALLTAIIAGGILLILAQYVLTLMVGKYVLFRQTQCGNKNLPAV